MTEVIKQGVGICLLRQRRNFVCRLHGNGSNQCGKVLCCTSKQTEAVTGFQTLWQAFQRNLVSSRLLLTAPHKAADLHFDVQEHLIWPLWNTTSLLTSRNSF
jgi:hypothetical protein